ncbi:MAG: ExbD/TolR family protein [Acidobacteriota bacterium]
MIHKVRKIEAVIPTASMADIAFLLIIFFMLTTSFSPVKTSVELPESEVRVEVAKDAAIVAIDAAGSVLVSDGVQEGRVIASYDEIAPFVLGIVTVAPDKQFVIRADRAVQYQVIDQVLERLRTSGARSIGLMTEQRSRARN